MSFFPTDEIDGLVGEKIGEVLAFGIGNRRIGLEVEMFAHADDGFVEAALGGVVGAALANVPFAKHGGGVAGFFELLGDGGTVEREVCHIVHRTKRAGLPIEPVDATHGVDAGAGTHLAAHERRAGGSAVLAVMVASEASTLAGQPINIWCFVVSAAETAQIGVAEIIGHDEDDVGLGSFCG